MKLLLTLSALTMILQADISLPNNFETDFQQSITNDKGKVIKYTGSVFFKNSNTRSLFKWSYASPTQKEVCTDGTQLIVVDHDLEQVSTYLIDDGVNLEAILKVANKISEKTYTASYKEVEYLIYLDERKQLQQIVYVDNLDNAVKIIFNNMNYNTSVTQNVLECDAPDTYDEIRG